MPYRFFRVLANDRHGLRRRDVVVRFPVFFVRDGIELLRENLLSLRNSISAAHNAIIAEDMRYCLKLPAASNQLRRPDDGPRLRWQIETLAAGAIESLHARVALGAKVQVKHQIFPGNL